MKVNNIKTAFQSCNPLFYFQLNWNTETVKNLECCILCVSKDKTLSLYILIIPKSIIWNVKAQNEIGPDCNK